MNIKLTEERECCQTRDLKPLNGHSGGGGYQFCQHCGRHFCGERYTDASGDMDTRNVPLPWPWEPPVGQAPGHPFCPRGGIIDKCCAILGEGQMLRYCNLPEAAH